MASRGAQGDTDAAAAATAQLPSRPTLEVGAHIEVRMEQGQPCWADLEVAEAHGDHVYTLVADLAAMECEETEGEDSEEDSEEEEEEEEGQEDGDEEEEGAAAEAGAEQPGAAVGGAAAGAAAAAASAGGVASAAPAAGARAGGAARAAAAAAARTARLQHLQARVVSESALVFQWSDSGETTHEWRPAAANLQDMFQRSFEKMAEMASIPASVGADMPLGDMAATAAAGLEKFIKRTIQRAEAAGTEEISFDLVESLLGEVAAEMGLPPPPPPAAKRQRR